MTTRGNRICYNTLSVVLHPRRNYSLFRKQLSLCPMCRGLVSRSHASVREVNRREYGYSLSRRKTKPTNRTTTVITI